MIKPSDRDSAHLSSLALSVTSGIMKCSVTVAVYGVDLRSVGDEYLRKQTSMQTASKNSDRTSIILSFPSSAASIRGLFPILFILNSISAPCSSKAYIVPLREKPRRLLLAYLQCRAGVLICCNAERRSAFLIGLVNFCSFVEKCLRTSTVRKDQKNDTGLLQ